MPVLTFEGPPIEDIEKKRSFVKGLTDVVCASFPNIPRKAILVLLKENRPDNVANGGQLLLDQFARQGDT